jgi:hypothetical protein
MGKKANSNDLFLEILVAEIAEAVLRSEKIQARFRQISKMGILEDIAHQTVGVNLGDLAKEIFDDVDIKDSFPQPGQEQNENNSELEKPSQEAPSIDDPESLDDNVCEKIINDQDESNCLSQQVDGRKLSPNEIRFQEYLGKAFDEKNWLKTAKIDYRLH